MVFITDLNGTTTLVESTPIYQGSSLANSITILCPMPRNNNCTVAFRLPNGMPTKPLLMTRLNNSIIGDNIVGELNAWSVELDTSITEYAGIVDVQFYFYQGYSNGSALAIQPTFKTSFEVQPGVVPELPETPSQNIYEQLLSALTNAENKIFGKLELFSENVFNVKTWIDALDGQAGDTFITNRIDPTNFFILTNPIFNKGIVSNSKRFETSANTPDWTIEIDGSVPNGQTLLSIFNGNTITLQNTGAQYSVLLGNNVIASMTFTEGEPNVVAIAKDGTEITVYFNANVVGNATITNSGSVATINVGVNNVTYNLSTFKIYNKGISAETLYNSWQSQVYRFDKINAAEEYKLDLLLTYSQDIARILRDSAGYNNASFNNKTTLVFYVNESIVKEVDISSVNDDVKASAYGDVDLSLNNDTLEMSPKNLNGQSLTPKSVALPFAKKSTKDVVSGEGYTVDVPSNSAPYALISKIGGMSRKCTNILPQGTKYNWACDVTIADDGTITYTRTGSGGTCFIDSNKVYLEANKTYSLRYAGSNNKYAYLYTEADGFRTDIYGSKIYTPTESGYYYIRVYMSDSLTSVGDSATVTMWIHEGDANLPYEPYYSGLRDAKVTEVKSVGVSNTYTLAIPEAVQSLDGYGQSNPDNANEYNYIDLANSKFITLGHIVNGTWESYNSTTDIDIADVIGVEGGGTLTFENEYGYDVPYEIEYTLNLNEVISANKFVGDLKGTAEVAKYYDDNGNPSTQTIGEALNKLLGAGNPIKITTESVGALSTTQVLTGISANIITNPPVAINDIILDRYLDGDAAYLCFWIVTNISGGSTDSTMTLQGVGNIYVGGGSASVADKAIADGNGNNIVSTYETKAEAQVSHGLLAANITTNANNIRTNAGEIANIKSGTTPVGEANYANNPSGNLAITIADILSDLASAVTRANLNTNYFDIVSDLIKVIKADSAVYASGNENAGTIDNRIRNAESLATTAKSEATIAATSASQLSSQLIDRAECTYAPDYSQGGVKVLKLTLYTKTNQAIEVSGFQSAIDNYFADIIN